MATELDMEELEQRLYSQIHHSSEETEPYMPNNLIQEIIKINENRYFEPKNAIIRNDNLQPVQQIVISPVHNYVVLPHHNDNTGSSQLTARQEQRRRAKKRKENKKKKMSAGTVVVPKKKKRSRYEVRNDNPYQSFLKHFRQLADADYASTSQMNLPNQNKPTKSPIKKTVPKIKSGEVICLSESDADDCVEIPQVHPLVFISDSEEEENGSSKLNDSAITASLDEDVIIVENRQEIIAIDDDSTVVPDIVNNSLNKSDAPVATIVQSPSTKTNSKTYAPGERKELLSTPDSNVSNDFLDNIDVSQKQLKFNFNLHGSDFNNSETVAEFVKPTNPGEIYETESSCSASTTDIGLVPNNIFKEVDFPDMFSESNMENFGKLITPNRKQFSNNSANESVGQAVLHKEVKDCASKNNFSSEGSSSESEYDEPNLGKSKKLPQLSHFEVDMQVESPETSKLVTSIPNKKPTKTVKPAAPSGEAVQKKPKKKKIKAINNELPTKSNKEQPEGSEKKKRKKTNSTSNADATSSLNTDKSNGLEESADKKKKKKHKTTSETTENKKGKESTPTTVGNAEINVNNGSENCDSKSEEGSDKKRKKKNKNIIDVSSETTNTEANVDGNLQQPADKKKRKKTKSNSDNADNNFSRCEIKETKIQKDGKGKEISNPVPQLQSSNEHNKKAESIPSTSNSVNLDPNKEKTPEDKIANRSMDALSGFIVIDEDRNSDSTESEYNFKNFDDVGHDLALANCLEPELINPTKSQTQLKRTKFTERWTKDKNKFYSKIVDVENFNVNNLQKDMSDDPLLWQILEEDKQLLNVPGVRKKRCNNCRQLGHIAIRCPDNKKPLKCKLCGGRGHLEPRCPNKLCFQCGNPADYSTVYCEKCIQCKHYICQICKLKGHVEYECPDLWRRYYLTTTEGEVVKEKEPKLLSPEKLWCSGCSRRGHMEYTCVFFNRIYPPSIPDILQYDDIYNDKGKCKISMFNRTNRQLPNSHRNNTDVFQRLGPAQPINTTISLSNPGPSNIITVLPTSVNQFNITHNQGNPPLQNFCNNFSNVFNINPVQNQRNIVRSNNLPQKHIFFGANSQELCAFIARELSLLRPLSPHAAQQLRQKMCYFENLIKTNSSVVEKYGECYREVNMLLFGVHRFLRGGHNCNVLLDYINDHNKICSRKLLWNAYNYIFGKEKHQSIDYMKYFKLL